MDGFTEAKKLMTGSVFKSGTVWPGPEVLQVAVENQRQNDETEQGVVEQQNTVQKKVKSLLQNKSVHPCNSNEADGYSRWDLQL